MEAEGARSDQLVREGLADRVTGGEKGQHISVGPAFGVEGTELQRPEVGVFCV